MAEYPSRVTIIILTWNGKHHLDACISSVLGQDFKNYSVLVVDNGSTDETYEYVCKTFPEVKLLRLEVNRGITFAFNAAVDSVESEYLVWLNNDTEVAPVWLKKLYDFMEAHPNVAVADSTVCYYDQRNIIWSAGACYTYFGTSNFRMQGECLTANFQDAEVFGAVGCAAIYRCSVFQNIGYLDPRFYLSHEDVDWSFRARLGGYDIYNVHDAIVYHKVSATNVPQSDTYVYYGQRNVHFVFLKNIPFPLLMICLPLHLLFVLVGIGYHLRLKRLRSFWNAQKDTLRLLPEILRDRRRIQATRCVSSRDILSRMGIYMEVSMRKCIGYVKKTN